MVKLILTLFLFTSINAGQLKAQKITPENHQGFYSLDLLPVKWKSNFKILQVIDEIVPNAFHQLKNSRSCMNCNAGYYVKIRIDTVYIMYGAMEYNTNSHAYGSSRNVNTTWFKYRSFLYLIDFKGREISRLIITDPEEKETFKVNATEKVYRAGCSAPVKYVGSYFSASLDIIRYVIVPTDREILDITAHKLKKIGQKIKNWNL